MSATITIDLKNDLQQTQIHIARRDRDDAVVQAVSLFLATLGPSVLARIVDELKTTEETR